VVDGTSPADAVVVVEAAVDGATSDGGGIGGAADSGSSDAGAADLGGVGDLGGGTDDASTAPCPGGWCTVPSGTLTLGSTAGDPCTAVEPRPVTISYDFEIGETEVTQAQYAAVLGGVPAQPTPCDDCPVVNVRWHDAARYCNQLTAAIEPAVAPCYACTGSVDIECTPVPADMTLCGGYRLPTEDEWEYAARGGLDTTFVTGDIAISRRCRSNHVTPDTAVEEVAWYILNSMDTIQPAQGKLPNSWGLYDTAGNALEWTDDWWDAGTMQDKVLKGGAFNNVAEDVRPAARSPRAPDVAADQYGFRCVRTLP
jgi:formylglycine-generating enzyme required for sulfatase activity